jgi:protein O-mannosyl-transferase
MLDCQFFGLNAGCHHLVNFLLQDFSGACGRSAFVAALFALHPLHVESVAWISERKEVLRTLLGLLTLGTYVRYVRKPGAARYCATPLLFALG